MYIILQDAQFHLGSFLCFSDQIDQFHCSRLRECNVNEFCPIFLCYCCLSWKGHMGERNKIFTGCSGRNFVREVIKRSRCATCKLFHWAKKTENAKNQENSGMSRAILGKNKRELDLKIFTSSPSCSCHD